jgi:hypothetical protein
VEVACAGGHGRTGTALACLAVLDGLPGDQAIAYVCRHYAPRAVETPWQRRFVTRFPTAPPDQPQGAAATPGHLAAHHRPSRPQRPAPTVGGAHRAEAGCPAWLTLGSIRLADRVGHPWLPSGDSLTCVFASYKQAKYPPFCIDLTGCSTADSSLQIGAICAALTTFVHHQGQGLSRRW